MMSRTLQGLRCLQRGLAQEARSGMQRGFSEATPSGTGRTAAAALSGESPTASRIFENVTLPPEAAAAGSSGAAAAVGAGSRAAVGGGATASAGGGAGVDALENSALGRALSAAGNVLFFGGTAAAAYFGYYTWRYDVDQVAHMVEETRKPENAFPGSGAWCGVMGWYCEKRGSAESEVQRYADPPSDKLLPDLPPHARHVKTLVLDLDGVLVHSHWTRGRGWRTFKRPGAEDFLRELSQYYELVVYTSALPTYADPILDRLDPHRLIQYRLYRDSTQYVEGRHVRDLSKLNRDPAQVLLLTADPEAYTLQPESAIKLKPWKLEEDTTLLDLLPFLEAVVRTNVRDVRDVVRSYEGKDVVEAFRERMKKVQEQQAQRQQAPRGLLAGIAKR